MCDHTLGGEGHRRLLEDAEENGNLVGTISRDLPHHLIPKKEISTVALQALLGVGRLKQTVSTRTAGIQEKEFRLGDQVPCRCLCGPVLTPGGLRKKAQSLLRVPTVAENPRAVSGCSSWSLAQLNAWDYFIKLQHQGGMLRPARKSHVGPLSPLWPSGGGASDVCPCAPAC